MMRVGGIAHHALLLSATRRHMSVTTEMMHPMMSAPASLVISWPPVYSKTFTGWCFRRSDAPVPGFCEYNIFFVRGCDFVSIG